MFKRSYSHYEEEEEHLLKLLLENYIIVRFKNYLDLKQKIDHYKSIRRNTKVETENQKSWVNSVLDIFSPTSKQSDQSIVEDYWSVNKDPGIKYNKLALEKLYSVLVLQESFRIWIILKKFRIDKEKRKLENLAISKSKEEREKIVERKLLMQQLRVEKEKRFKKFCEQMIIGYNVMKYNNNDGNMKKYIIKFDADYRNLILKGNRWMNKSLPLNSIYLVEKGLTDRLFHLTRNSHLSWCFHIKATGSITIEMQALDGDQARDLFDGFEMLRSLLFTQIAFYVDELGIPRRAGPSFIERALQASID